MSTAAAAPETKDAAAPEQPQPVAPPKKKSWGLPMTMTLAQRVNSLSGLALMIFWIMLIVRTSAMGRSRYTCTRNPSYGRKQASLYTWGIVLCVLVVFLPGMLNGAGMHRRSKDDDSDSRYDWSSVFVNGALLAGVVVMWHKLGAHTPTAAASESSMFSFYS